MPEPAATAAGVKTSKIFEYEKKVRQTYGKLKAAYAEIKESYSEMIFRFALAAEYKDESTGTHLVRIADYCTEIGKGLKLPRRALETLRYASPMHDIGKLVIPDAILKKPAGLTPEEREVVKKHTTLGADIFKSSSSSILKAAGEISLTHHERYDGTGYPRGLRGDAIPLFGRITALADVFDALTTKRPYKDAYDFPHACRIIAHEAGSHFDPRIVSVFLARKKRIREILKATQDIEHFIEGH